MTRPAQPGGALHAPSTLFLVQATLWIVGLFALLRLPWVTDHIVGTLIVFQTTVLGWYGTAPGPAVAVVPSCSGADVAALCLGVTLAYPVTWSRRLIGAAVGGALVFGVNIVRIATLSAAAASPSAFSLLHYYVWPGALALLVVGYVLAWIRWNARRDLIESAPWGRFCRLTLGGLVIYAASAPWALASPLLARAGAWTAWSAATALTVLGAPAQAFDTRIVTPRGGFVVTQECLFTPIIPLFFAAVLAMPMPRARRWTWIALAPVVFFALAVVRVLTLALPPFVVDRPLLLVHGFYQLVAAAALVTVAASYGACTTMTRRGRVVVARRSCVAGHDRCRRGGGRAVASRRRRRRAGRSRSDERERRRGALGESAGRARTHARAPTRVDGRSVAGTRDGTSTADTRMGSRSAGAFAAGVHRCRCRRSRLVGRCDARAGDPRLGRRRSVRSGARVDASGPRADRRAPAPERPPR